MKLTLVFMAILAICAAIPMNLKKEIGPQFADKTFLMKQKFIFDVLYNMHMPMSEEYMKDVEGFVEGKEYYDNYDAVLKFFMMYKYGLLPQNYIFSVFNYRHVTEVRGLFYLFYYSRDWNTFYRNVLWARFHVNQGMFVYALYAAVIHRQDLQGIILPAHYEVMPYMYFNGLTIDEIMKYKMLGVDKLDKDVVILSKYTDEILPINEDSKLAYFTEDIGWNMYYFFYNIDYPHGLGGKEFGLYKDRRGEQYLYMHQQLLARYYLERLSNGLGEIPELSWYKPLKTGYNPHLKYYNGLPFSSRKNYYEIFTDDDFYALNRIEDFERRIRDVIDLGYFETMTGGKVDLWSKDGIDILGNMIQSNPDSINEQYFGKLIAYAYKMLGSGNFKEMYDYKVIPGAMEHYETQLRDPIFYQFYKRIIKFWYQYKLNMPSYKYDDLYLPGVKIEKVDISKLVTYFDYFDADVSTLLEYDTMWKDYDKEYMDMDYMYKDYVGKKYFYDTDKKYMDKDYMKKDFYNKEFYNKDFYNKDFYNKDFYNKDFYNKDFYSKDFYSKDFYNKDFYKKDSYKKDFYKKDFYNKEFYDKDYAFDKDYYKKDYMYNKDYKFDKDYYMKKDLYDKDYYMKKDMYDKDYYLKKDIYDKDYMMGYYGDKMPYGYKYVMSKDYFTGKDYYMNKDYSMKKDYMMDKDYLFKKDYHMDKDYTMDKDYMLKKDYMMDKDYYFDKDYTMGKDYMLKKDYVMDKPMEYYGKTDFDFSKFMKYKMADYKFKIRQWRLNHKPFTVSLDVTADKPQTVVFRVYMGPKFDYMGKLISINENRDNFVEIDQFVYDLKSGVNTIHRESRDFYYSVKDRTKYTDLYKMVMMGLEGKFQFPLDMSESHVGFPDRLLLPKGWTSGMPMQFFFMITPYKDVKQFSNYKFWFTPGIGSGTRFIDDLPFGYPFDRWIDETYFYTPNMYFKDTFIYHIDEMQKYTDVTLDKMDMYNTKDLMFKKMDSGMYYKYPWMMKSMDKMEYKDIPYKYSDVMQKVMPYK